MYLQLFGVGAQSKVRLDTVAPQVEVDGCRRGGVRPGATALWLERD